jgi:hypothetical protein
MPQGLHISAGRGLLMPESYCCKELMSTDTIVTLESAGYFSQWDSVVGRLGARYEPTDHLMRAVYLRTVVADLDPLADGSKRWSDEELIEGTKH